MRVNQFFFTLFLLLLNVSVFSQSKDVKLPVNWFNLDLVKNGVFGISTERAYMELLHDKKPKQRVIVAVIDGGIDIDHEDLKDVLWINKNEIPGNGIDDDGNGYIDDVHGWNFIGSKRGNLAYDNLELVRIYRNYAPKYSSTIKSTVLDSIQKKEFELYTKATADFGRKYDDADRTFRIVFSINKVLESIVFINKKAVPTLQEIDAYKAEDEVEEQVKKVIKSGIKESGGVAKFYKEIKDAYKQYDVMLRYNLNPKYDQRSELVGDDYSNPNDNYYGNNDVKGPNAEHGSHVSGIIGANRSNALGINGVADYISLMGIRVVPEGDERDKDVANGIRYAVDNGARIINMSFGKGYKWDKKIVDVAVKYAESKGVLLVHASGNDNLNVDKEDNYPNKYYDSPEFREYMAKVEKSAKKQASFRPLNGRISNQRTDRTHERYNGNNAVDSIKSGLPQATNWIEVGASAYKNNSDLKASFSNYGKYSVDVFAPGFMINSTVPESLYEEFDGTSMAAPVVSGLAALILSYYPDFTAKEIREIILSSVSKVVQKVKLINDKGQSVRVPFSDLCVSGGVVNAYEALKLAEIYSKKR
ncbi:S8 family peptidase [Pedobacter sp. PLR]|uniref:S8 family peptidase n=1 Tax=Pedobacter sp. PLR TaxID=2994465 RepID=UPI002247FFD7|nr:S8 family peptidase [Pedobacter sp. PLR]MCX2451039.1 S8 family peptidase [Pedobacter sp. PLR]